MRLRPLMPPPNFGAAKTGAIYRSAFPQDRNIEFLKTLHIRSVL
jgi:tyrosine-protein phosphatase SIW14